MINKDRMIDHCAKYGITIDTECAEKLDLYAELLVEGNKKCNLTSILEPDEIMIKHFLDSLTGLIFINSFFASFDYIDVVDVGSGAGFPGVVLALGDKRIRLTVIDSSRKRIDFLSELSDKLGITVNCVHARAEDAGHDVLYRERFDLSVSRAVAQLNVLAEYCTPFLKVDGYFLAYKGKKDISEIDNSNYAFSALNCSLIHSESLFLPDDSERTLLLYKKIAPSGEKYPRRSSKISKSPL